MRLLSLENISMNFGSDELFSGLSLTVESSRRYALIGPNGVGKSTLARIIAEKQAPTEGIRRRETGVHITYVPQIPAFRDGMNIIDALNDPWEPLRTDLREAEEHLSRLGDDVDSRMMERAMNRYQQSRDAWDAIGGDNLVERGTGYLSALGMPGPYDRPVSSLSGGEAGLLAMASALAEEPDLLILDEPGNHLDFEGLAWLEAFLSRYRGTLLIISHNRYLMDRLCDTVFELDHGKLEIYPGNYSDYRLTRLRKRAADQATYKSRLRHVERLEDLVKKFEEIASRVADPAWGKRLRSRRKQLELARGDLGEKQKESARVGVQLSGEASRAEVAIRIQDYARSFGSRQLFSGASAEVRSGEKVAVLGPNGSGKSTLIHDLLKHGDWYGGESSLRIGPSFTVGHMAQEYSIPDSGESLEDHIRNWGALSRDEAFDQVSGLGFEWDELSKPVAALSGGELARVQLARLNYHKANLLILDEPTNHLDIYSREAMEEALSDFPGTLLVVSHDRYFLDKIVDRVLEIRDSRLVSHPGGFSDWWMDRSRGRSSGRLTTRGKERQKKRSAPDADSVEKKIEFLETEKQELEIRMERAHAAGDYDASRRLGDQLDKLNRRLEELWERWTG